VTEILFEWDENKNRANQRKHGLSFEEAMHAFYDPLYVSVPDRIVDGELRWQTFGVVSGVTLLVVAHTIREEIHEGIGQKLCALSLRGERKPEKGDTMKEKIVRYRLDTLPPLSEAQKANLERLAALPDNEIDTSDIPVLTDEQWKHAVRGQFYRPVKKQVTARLDADVLDWLKSQGKGYQSRMNAILRREMLAASKRQGAR
jgi:uncharacterized protein (DUF4415 family)